jgi:transposase
MAMQVDLHAAHSQLSRILAGRSVTHPLRYLAWMSLVFDSWSDFQTTLGLAANSFSKNEPTSSAAIQVVDVRPAAAVDSLRTGQESLTAVARKFDVSVATVAAWAAAAGIATPRRPKVLHESLWLTAVQLLVDGNAKAMVAERCGVSIVTITRILRMRPRVAVKLAQCPAKECTRARARYLDKRCDRLRHTWYSSCS